jgi:hypothetical protein
MPVMNARPAPQSNPDATAPAAPAAPPAPRFDRKFIEDHNLLERYLEGKLPVRGARDLENWCRNNPGYLTELKLSERAQSSLKLLEACGSPVDLTEAQPPWWKSVYVLIGMAALTLLSLTAFWVLLGKQVMLRNRLEEARVVAAQGSLVQPASETSVTITPDRAPDMDRARIVVSRSAPQLLDVHVDLAYTQPSNAGVSAPSAQLLAKKLMTFRMVVDKKGQGRALVINNLLKDSNNQLRLTLNSTGLSAGIYTVRIEGMPFGGGSYPVGWLLLEVK